MKHRFKIRPLGPIAKCADGLMYPVMFAAMQLNAADDSPQLTHLWNNQKLSKSDVEGLDSSMIVRVEGDANAWSLPGLLGHFPIIGWQKYVVLQPSNWNGSWYLGWTTPSMTGFSRLKHCGAVRALRRPTGTGFFALDPSGQPLPLRKIGQGKLGNGGPFKDLPLL